MENPTFEDFNRVAFYSTYIRPCCELGRAQFTKSSSKRYKTGDICKIWCSKPIHELRKYCDVIKICTFRPLLFVPQCNHTKKCHDPSDCQFGELNLERLYQIETLEDVTDIAKKFANDPFFINGILKIGTEIDNRIFSIVEALDWVKYADDIGILQKLEKLGNYCWPFLEIFFAEYKHNISKVVLEDYDLVEAFDSQYCETCVKKSENMKKTGNEAFAKEEFDIAVNAYTKAIELWPENHLLYGNRALCFLRTGEYKKALCDGKRSIILKPSWPKGHYRFCDALSLLGEHTKALQANEKGQELCRDNPEGINDLTQQHEKLKKQMEEIRGVKQSKHRMKKWVFHKNSSESTSVNIESKKSDTEKRKHLDLHNHFCQQKQTKVASNTLTKENKDQLSESTSGLNENPRKSRNKMSDSENARDQLNLKNDYSKGLEEQNASCGTVHQVDAIVSLEMLKTHITQGYTSLMDQRFHSAEKSFAFLLNNLDSSQLQQLNLAVVDYVVTIYGYATALIGIGQPEELTKAKGHFNNIIEQYQKLRFDCLAHYGIGKVYLRQNRFSDALEQFMKSKTMVHHKMVPGVLTWPTTSIVIEETRTEKLQVILQDCIEECKFPPNADAVCRYQNCQAHKIKIYFSDPDFKGFIRVACCEQCIVEFHVSCWKKQKATRYSDKNDKDILRELCFTPDCEGLISKIVIVGASGFVKCEFEQKIKKKTPPRPVIKQKCSSSRNIERKQQRKLKRKFMKEEVSVQLRELAEAFHKEDCPARDASKKGNHEDFFPKDPVLQLIIRHSVNIRAGVHDAFKLLNELLSWSVLSEEDCVEFSTGCGSSAEIMDQLINFLVAKNERVKTRIFVHVLSEFEEVEPKLHDWMKHLDNKGLKATDSFFAQYIVYTVEADFKLVAVLWNEKYGIKLGKKFTCTSEDMIEWLDYLCNLSTIDLRYFLWLLEENREKFPFFHQYLDDYFDSWDNPFTVIRKEETETTSNNAIKVKNRNRKKAKESKAILVVPGGVSTIAREEDNIFSEESTLSFMNSHEPFRIPDSLHEQVEIFEALNNNVSSSSSYQRILDNYPNPTCESLYDYFSQILEEHGPMEIDHQLLVGEYKHFPAETRKIVEDAGGLKSFLLESLRFVMMGDLIGLMKHAVMLTENADISGVDEITRKKENNSACLHSEENSSQSKVRLNPAAKEFKPTSYINKPFVTISSNTVTSNTLEYMTVNSSSFSSFVSEYSSSRAVDTIATSLPLSKVSLSSAISEIPPIFLNADPLQCQDERTAPMLSETPLVPDILEQPKYICTDNDAYLDTDSKAILGSNYSAGNLVASDEVQKFQNPQCMPVESDSHISENHPYQSENRSNEAAKMETEIKTIARNNPRSRMIAVQVDQERTDKGVNTLPLHPYETQQGDMLRTEKEHQVLQEQLKDASEKYEQLKCRSSTETSGLEDELSLLIEGNKLTKRELDWFHQDVEMEMKRWQQEKKENQEGLKTGKSKVKKLTEINETYMKNTEEKDKQYKQYLEEFLAISNKFENEKVKMEELIKKSCGDHQECVKRAVAAEVSVLENWKETELYKLQRRATHAEANLKYLKFMTSHSTVPQSKLQIDSWETFISNIKEEIRNTENEFEERIRKVKNGAFLNDIPMVEIAELQSPSGLSSATCEWPLINDPAIVMYSATATYLSSAFSNTDDNDPVHSAITVQPGIKTSSKGPRLPLAKKDIGETSLESKAQSLSDHVCLPDSPENSRKSVQAIHLQYRTPEESPPTAGGLDQVKTISKPLPKASTNIIAQLRTIFPHHSSSDLENFIKEVKVKNKNKLSTDELLSRVTEFILDHPNKKKVLCSSGKIEKPSSGASGQNGNQIQKVLKMSGRNVPNLAKSRVTNENIKKTTLPPQSVQMPWKTVGGTSKSKWKKPSDMDNDPCVICHEELSSEMLHVLDCGHRFHKLT
ncbi:E3 ubiquitin-protein ligase TTC3 isoform X2 [Sceloporus undulatus]|uniref:E3 ubiquitin-protein ligase TTC3 isoform X2 n=1 Tax=Sceloporus undulatus TaxID=8520 RepID=UPI001C4B4D1A|nr:E3 ubiquitin-protein ligase TTC3 isoform X2 [Sceloporus undulatus]